MTGFTPGPWIAENNGGRGSWIKGSNGNWSALSCGDSDAEANANARLIAAAPEMLRALRAAHAVVVCADVDKISRLAERLILVEEAIAKAEGR